MIRIIPLLLLACLALPIPSVATSAGTPQQDVMVHLDTSGATPKFVPGTAVPIEIAPGGLVQLMLFGKGPAHSLTLDDLPGYEADVPASDADGFYERTAELHAPTTPGSYRFHDRHDPSAVGTLVVVGDAAGPATIGVGQGYDTRFYPERLVVAPGATVRFTNNNSQIIHTLTARDGRFDADAVEPGTETTFTAPATPGEYPFFCKYHQESGMVGVLVVEAPAQSTAPAAGSGTAPRATAGLGIGVVLAACALIAFGRRR